MGSPTSLNVKMAVLTAIFAASAIAVPANASIIKRDEYGFKARKTCLFDNVIRTAYLEDPKKELLARAQSAEWNMELYVNKKTNDWVLLGKSRDPAAYPGETCVLSANHIRPYQEEKWYGLFFEKNTPAKEKLAKQPGAKPNLN